MTKQEVATQQQAGSVAELRPLDRFKTNFERMSPTVMALLPAHITFDHFKAMTVTAVAYNEKLLECTPNSLVRAVCELADLGLSANPKMKEADILPRWNGKLKKNEAHAEPRFEGLMKLARQSGEVIDIYAHEVCENDDFSYSLGLNKTLHHIPARGDRGAITYAYVVWTTKDGIKGFEVVDRKRIDRARSASESYKAFEGGKLPKQYVTWITDEGEMCRKTAVRAGAKYFPKSTESDKFRKALALADIDPEEIDGIENSRHEAIAPPKPTRQQARDEAEQARKDEYQRSSQFRQTMQEDVPRDPIAETGERVDTETGEVTEGDRTPPEPDDRDAGSRAAPQSPSSGAPQPSVPERQAAPAAPDYEGTAKQLIELIGRSSSRINFEKIVANRSEDIDLLRTEAAEHYEAVQKAIVAKRAWFSK